MHVVYADIGRTCRTRLRSVPRSRLASPPRGRSFGRSVSLVLLFSPLPLPFAQRTHTRTVCVITGEGVRTGLVITLVHWGSTCVLWLCVRETATFECGEPPRDDGRETFLPPLTHYVYAVIRCHGMKCVTVMILPQVHLRKPCYDFYFL